MNGSTLVPCAGCSGSEYVGFIGGPPQGTLTISNISSEVKTNTTVRIQYTNGDPTQRYVNVFVNGISYITAFLPTADGVTTGVSTLNVPLNSGNENMIEIEGYNDGWGKSFSRGSVVLCTNVQRSEYRRGVCSYILKMMVWMINSSIAEHFII